ncbi:MAG TPA: SpoIIE family protein phosphatase [Candidatus Acidoferrum sp.]|nr:SpoIIE family protein phosphatase [Candidatus Acidoferrum sp.]
MVLPDGGETKRVVGAAHGGEVSDLGRTRLARELFSGRFQSGRALDLNKIAAEHGMDNQLVLKTFAEFQALGMVTLVSNSSAIVNSPDPKEMQDAYEIRAALEEIAARTAATTLKGNVAGLLCELEGMRSAVSDRNLDACIEHDISFHRIILEASQNEALLRVWDTLTLDLRMRAVIGKISEDLRDVVESHQPIVDALQRGRGRQAGLLLRNHVETFSEYIRKSQSDSGFHRALQRDLEGAKDVQQAFFPPRTFSIPFLSCETFYRPAHEIGGDYYDLISLQGGRWGIAIGDVSGKGIGAALVMASLQASLRAKALHPHLDLSSLIEDVNRLVFASSPAHLFATLFYAEYESATRILNYVNAGHNPLLVVRTRNGSCEVIHLKPNAMPVGISADSQFASEAFQLEIDDLLVAYTDGITETENRHGEFWGQQRLEAVLRSCSLKTPEQIIQNVLNQVSTFADGQPQHDDMTLVVIGVQAGCDV